jgi:hypothetical protein
VARQSLEMPALLVQADRRAVRPARQLDRFAWPLEKLPLVLLIEPYRVCGYVLRKLGVVADPNPRIPELEKHRL